MTLNPTGSSYALQIPLIESVFASDINWVVLIPARLPALLPANILLP